MVKPCALTLLVTVYLLIGSGLNAQATDSVWIDRMQRLTDEQQQVQHQEQQALQAVEQAEAARQYAIRIDDRQALPVAERARTTASRALERTRKKLQRLAERLAAVNNVISSQSDRNVAVASKLRGKVEIKTSQGWITLSPDTLLNPGETIRTGAMSSAEVMFSDGTRVNLDADTSFVLESEDSSRSDYRLNTGKIKAYFKRYGERRYRVRTTTAVAGVRGTEFLIETTAAGATALVVLAGVVEMGEDDEPKTLVQKGELVIYAADMTVHGPEVFDLKSLQPWWDD